VSLSLTDGLRTYYTGKDDQRDWKMLARRENQWALAVRTLHGNPKNSKKTVGGVVSGRDGDERGAQQNHKNS